MSDFYKFTDEKINLNIYVNPNSKREGIAGIFNNKLRIKISAPAVDGKANKAVINFFSKYFKISKSKIKIIKGEFSRDKVIEINSNSHEIIKKLEEVKNANL